MNYRLIFNILGRMLIVEAGCMVPSLAIAMAHGADDAHAFALTILFIGALGGALSFLPREHTRSFGKESFVCVSLGWIVLSILGALPFMLSGYIPNFIDAVFETISGFTTTGASILTNVELLPEGLLFWRSFTHWLGGMGILVLTLAVLPSIGKSPINLMRAESPGPTPGKLVPRLAHTAKLLYLIYISMTVLNIAALIIAGMPVFDSFVHAFGTAGTGGFSIKAASIGAYNSVPIEVITTVFMFLFGVNFTLHYQLLKRNFRSVFKNEELRFYILSVAIAIAMIVPNIVHMVGGFPEALRQASFQVSSIITTTGYATTDFNLWPGLSKWVLLTLMVLGCCAGSTGGGLKAVRSVILFKAARRTARRILHPREVNVVKLDGRVVEPEVVSDVIVYFFIYIAIAIAGVLIISFDGHSVEESLAASLATLGNIGPGLGVAGPAGSFAGFSGLSKVTMSLLMLFGRLEIVPLLLLFMPTTWRRG